ncbi:hypothetical protein Tco_1383330, partial [Tanacetum coccineum]
MSPGNVAREGIPFELFRSTYPGRHVARERYPQRQVARDTPDLSLGNIANVVVIQGDSGESEILSSLTTSSSSFIFRHSLSNFASEVGMKKPEDEESFQPKIDAVRHGVCLFFYGESDAVRGHASDRVRGGEHVLTALTAKSSGLSAGSNENQEEEDKIDMQRISDADIYWERKLMTDYSKIIALSKENL